MKAIVIACALAALPSLAQGQTFFYEQPMFPNGGVLRMSELWVDPSGQNDSDNDAIAWEDFELPQAAVVSRIRWWGEAAPPLGFLIGFYNQDPNTVAVQPDLFRPESAPISEHEYTSFTQTPVGGGLYRFELDLASPIAFAANTRYFISVVGLSPVFSQTWRWAQGTGGQNGTFWWQRGAHMYFHLGDERAVGLATSTTTIGTSYCGPGVANSTGLPAAILAEGSGTASDNDVTLRAIQLPKKQFGYFLNSQVKGFVANPGGSQGNLCLGGAIGRYSSSVFDSGKSGTGSLHLDLTQTPTPSGLTAVVAGQTWNFQTWHRDVNPGVTSNFTDALTITFQ